MPGPLPRITRPTRVEIHLGNIAHNFRLIRAHLPDDVRIMGVVKADAYHHGAVEVARVLEGLGIDYLAVALVEEGIALREAGIRRPVMLLSGAYGLHPRHLIHYRLQPVVYDLETLSRLQAQADRPIPVHVKLDTGMGRLGFQARELPVLLQMLGSMDRIRIAGLLTHFANADEADDRFTATQVERFRSSVERFRAAGVHPALLHAANSATVFRYPHAGFNMVRPGFALYGISPLGPEGPPLDLRPAMELKSAVIQVKWVEAGHPLSYGGTFVTTRPTLVATVPIGYADGYDRGLSGKGLVLVHGVRCPVVGRVCMDLLMVDVTDAGEDVRIGDEVVLLGRQGDAHIDIAEVARWLGTIPYEVMCAVSSRVHREYRRDAPDDAGLAE